MAAGGIGCTDERAPSTTAAPVPLAAPESSAAAACATTGPIGSWQIAGTELTIDRFDAGLRASTEPVWSRAYPGDVGVGPFTVDPDHNILFGGVLVKPTDFGGGTLEPAGRVWWNVNTAWPLFPQWPYLLALTP